MHTHVARVAGMGGVRKPVAKTLRGGEHDGADGASEKQPYEGIRNICLGGLHVRSDRVVSG